MGGALSVRGTAASAAAVLAAAGLLLVPALWNGYVLFYYDSVDYVRMSFTWSLPVFRTMPYTLVAALGRLADTLWVVPLVQALAVAWVLFEALRVLSPDDARRALVPVTGFLCVFTALPWITDQVMADVFAGVAVLAITLLAFGDDRLTWARRIVLTLLVAVGTAVHTSHVAIIGGLVAALGLARFVLRRRVPGFRPALLLPLVAVGSGVAMVLAVHWVTVGRPFVTQPNSILMLARLVQDGIAKRYLDDVCPGAAPPLRLCQYRDRLPPTANDFLWGDTPFDDLGGWQTMESEARQIVGETLRRYPVLHVKAAFALTLEQLTMMATGDGLVNMEWHLRQTIFRRYPQEYDDFMQAEQQHGIPFRLINAVHVPALALSTFATVLLLIHWWRRGQWRQAGLALVVLLSLLGNAFVCGALSNPNHRYQSRLAWLTVLVVAIGGRSLVWRGAGWDEAVNAEWR